MKLDKDTKEFISEVVKYAVTEAVKQANEDAKKAIEAKKTKTTFDERRAKAAVAKEKHDRAAVA